MTQKVKGYIFSEQELSTICDGILLYKGRVQDDTEYSYGRIILEDWAEEKQLFTDREFSMNVLANIEM